MDGLPQGAAASPGDVPHVLIIVQNLPIQVDRRVQLELRELIARGYAVSLICPKGPGDAARDIFDGARIYKYRPAPQATGAFGFLIEFAYSWLRTAILSVVVRIREGRFAVIQACNPPDTYWLLALLWRPFGVKFVFDHHDLNPELFLSRFGTPKTVPQKFQLRGLLWLERRTFRCAHSLVATNDSYKAVAVTRGGRSPEDVTVVRSGPDTAVMRPIYPADPLPPGVFMLTYLGIMGPQDNVDQVLDLMAELVTRRGRTDVHATLMGFGDCLDALKLRCTELDLDSVVTFTGRVGQQEIAEHLSRAHVGIGPDLKTPLNDLSTMNKTMEYMAYALPVVTFDLAETRVSGGEAVCYVPSGDLVAMADQVERLIAAPAERVRLSLLARRRVAGFFDWSTQAASYAAVFDDLLNVPHAPRPPAPPPASLDRWGRTYVPTNDPAEYERFLLERRAP